MTIKSLETGKECRRNISHLKKLSDVTSTCESSNDAVPSNEEAEHSLAAGNEDIQVSTEARELIDRRLHLQRNRKEPARFLDYLPH